MPSRGSYQLANVVEGKAAERDQSYRSCVLSLLIFFFLCIILILVSLPWKSYRYYNSEEKDEYMNTMQVSLFLILQKNIIKKKDSI